jgi:hypothetical protein
MIGKITDITSCLKKFAILDEKKIKIQKRDTEISIIIESILEAFLSQKFLSMTIIDDSPPSEKILKINIIDEQITKMPKSDGMANLAIIIEARNPIACDPPVFKKLQKKGFIDFID